MPVIEYKLIKTKEGNEVPPYVKNGGNWRNPEDHSMVGWLDPEPRKYWVPDTLVELSAEDFLQRGMDMHSANPFTNTPVDPSVDSEGSITYMDSAEVTDMLNSWYLQFKSDNTENT
jgi:hypothetical protein